ncbi:DNA cytosine methyltransferase [Paenibacillus sp. y28]|uniref:DNA cytosine methyltransferase n=1 Tax=Paenibacillus sp. y28 TaxID=3129110 RepID=UPI003015A07B
MNSCFSEIFIDNFAGGGGASTGIELAIGRSVDAAINHDPAAIAMHEANHPDTKHYCESVWDVHPLEVTRGRPVALCWLSPDCTHHSKARGGKPRKKGIRGLAWVAVRWAATARPRVIMLENVEEFQDWGPLDEYGKPIKSQKGRTFRSFVNALKRQGYEVEWRILKACDYGAPTIRKRLFMIARRDGRPIVWPEPTHVPVTKPFKITTGGLLPYRRAADIIDWSIPVPSIFGRKRELADNTKRRIARGIDKFILQVAAAGGAPFMAPYLVNVNHGGEDFRGQGLDKPLQTITGKNGIGLATPYIVRIGQTNYGSDRLQYGLNQPLTTITTKGEHMLACANLIQYHSETQRHEVRGQTLDQPIMTLDTSNRYGLVLSHLIKFRGENIGSAMTDPVPTITAGGMHIGAVYAFMVAYYGSSIGQELQEPLGTVTTHDRFGLVLVRIRGVDYVIVDIGMRMLTPRELYRAQGFPESYIINLVFNGKPFTQAEQVAKCGNSVAPVIPAALVRANLPEHCIPKYTDRFSWEEMLA